MTMQFPEGQAIVYCEGAFNTPNGKTAHGLVRRTLRYELLSIIDSNHAGADAGEVLDGRPVGVPVVASLAEALDRAAGEGRPATHFVIGLAPDGGRLPRAARIVVEQALRESTQGEAANNPVYRAPSAESPGHLRFEARRLDIGGAVTAKLEGELLLG